ncbi:MAG: type II toxin-antitoxin system Phd/YefM family antitoxin [Acidimicrobiia bacterium]
MIRVGIRELRQDASTWVRRAAAGETIEVTDRGRPVAQLGPLATPPRGLAALEAAGLIRKGRGKLSDLPPIEPKPGSRPLSEILQEMRDEEDW